MQFDRDAQGIVAPMLSTRRCVLRQIDLCFLLKDIGMNLDNLIVPFRNGDERRKIDRRRHYEPFVIVRVLAD